MTLWCLVCLEHLQELPRRQPPRAPNASRVGEAGEAQQRETLPLCAEVEVALPVEARFRPAPCGPPGT